MMGLTPLETDRLADGLAEAVAKRLGGGPDEVGDVYAAARWLGVSVPTIERYRRAGLIPSFKIGRSRRYRRGDLLALRNNGGAQ
jgi:excisionase family DNA binding protein